MTVDLDALIAEARGKITGTWQGDDETPLTADEIGQLQDLYERLADALELTLAELRQEREWADEVANHAELALAGRRNAVAALSRAEEAIDRAMEFNDVTDRDGWWHVTKMRRILTEYGKQEAAGFRRTVQGEPTDAQVSAALLGYFPEVEGQPDLQDWGKNTRDRMRAALRAAAAARKEKP